MMGWKSFSRKEREWSKTRKMIENAMKEYAPEGLPPVVEERVYACAREYFLEQYEAYDSLKAVGFPSGFLRRGMVLAKSILELQAALVEYARSPEGAGAKRLLDEQGFQLPPEAKR
jgi:hypothetical protein